MENVRLTNRRRVDVALTLTAGLITQQSDLHLICAVIYPSVFFMALSQAPLFCAAVSRWRHWMLHIVH